MLELSFPQISLFFAGKHRKVSGCLLSNYESEFHRTRCAWIFNDGLEQPKNVVNSEKCRIRSKQVGILSAEQFFDEKKKLEDPQKLWRSSTKLDPEDVLNSKCSVFLCVDDEFDVQTEKTNFVMQELLRKSKVKFFWGSLARYLAEEKGLFYLHLANCFMQLST